MTTTRSLRVAWFLTAMICAGQSLLAAPPEQGGRLLVPSTTRSKPAAAVLVKVNGESVTKTDLQRLWQLHRIPLDQRAAREQEFLKDLIDQKLILQFLKSRKLLPRPEEVAEQLDLLKAPGDRSRTPRSLGASMFDETGLREEITLGMGWRKHLDLIASPQAVREFFRKHQQEFDGTELRVSHLVFIVPTDRDGTELRDAEARLKSIRAEIIAGKISFADAARKHSQGPSRDQGGDVGLILFRGKLPDALSDAAFRLKLGEVSGPIRTPFGVHLCVVTERKAGEISLEDARPQVLRRMSEEIWRNTVADLRAHAKIEWLNAAQPESSPSSPSTPSAPSRARP